MNRRITIGVLASVGLLLPTLEGPAAARSVSAAAGAIFTTGEPDWIQDCLEFDYETGAVRSSCLTQISVPLAVDNAGTKAATFSGRNPAPLPEEIVDEARCFAVASDRLVTTISRSRYELILTRVNSVPSHTTDSVAVPSGGVFGVDCILNTNTELYAFDYPR